MDNLHLEREAFHVAPLGRATLQGVVAADQGRFAVAFPVLEFEAIGAVLTARRLTGQVRAGGRGTRSLENFVLEGEVRARFRLPQSAPPADLLVESARLTFAADGEDAAFAVAGGVRFRAEGMRMNLAASLALLRLGRDGQVRLEGDLTGLLALEGTAFPGARPRPWYVASAAELIFSAASEPCWWAGNESSPVPTLVLHDATVVPAGVEPTPSGRLPVAKESRRAPDQEPRRLVLYDPRLLPHAASA